MMLNISNNDYALKDGGRRAPDWSLVTSHWIFCIAELVQSTFMIFIAGLKAANAWLL